MKNFFKQFKDFAWSKITIVLFAMGMLYPIIMIGVYVPSYSHASNSIDELTIAIVNQDESYGISIASSLAEALPTKTTDNLSLEKALEKLNDKKIDMIIEIPSDFTELLYTGQIPQMNYYTNGAMASMTKGVTSSIAGSIQGVMQQQFSFNTAQSTLESLGLDEEMAASLAATISAGINSNTITINDTGTSLQNQIGPMFLMIASYVCGLMCATMLAKMIGAKRKQYGRNKTLLFGVMLGFGAAILAPLGGILIFAAFTSFSFASIMQIWLVLACVTFGSLMINLICNTLLGEAGALLGTVLMLTQLMASGAIINRALMLGIFKAISYITPMSYAFTAIGHALFGGVGFVSNLLWLLLIDVVLAGILFGVNALKGIKKQPEIAESLVAANTVAFIDTAASTSENLATEI